MGEDDPHLQRVLTGSFLTGVQIRRPKEMAHTDKARAPTFPPENELEQANIHSQKRECVLINPTHS